LTKISKCLILASSAEKCVSLNIARFSFYMSMTPGLTFRPRLSQ
jgi:hypothetical protein